MSIALGGLLIGEVINSVGGGGSGSAGSSASTGLGGVLSGLLEKLPLGNYVGELNAIIQNGWNLKCFNSTFKSNTETEFIESYISVEVSNAINKMDIATTETGLEKAINEAAEVVQQSFYIYRTLQDANNWESCSRKALDVGINAGKQFQRLFNESINILSQSYNITVVQELKKPVTFIFNGKEKKGGDYGRDIAVIPVFKVERKSIIDNPSQNITGVGTGNEISTSVITTGLSVASAIVHYFINKNSY